MMMSDSSLTSLVPVLTPDGIVNLALKLPDASDLTEPERVPAAVDPVGVSETSLLSK